MAVEATVEAEAVEVTEVAVAVEDSETVRPGPTISHWVTDVVSRGEVYRIFMDQVILLRDCHQCKVAIVCTTFFSIIVGLLESCLLISYE